MRLFPIAASKGAQEVDLIFWGLFALSAAIGLIVIALIWVFGVRYRRGSKANRAALPLVVGREFEIGWTAGALFLALFIFWFAASAQLKTQSPPANALEVHVVGRQWMWKIQHAGGAREINALHAPLGRPVKLIMTSQDTIHDFYVPAFRMKSDVLPGRWTQTWFQATRLGDFPIACAEYCGTDHSTMGGVVTVMTPEAFARWAAVQPLAGSDVTRGQAHYARLGCGGCHGAGGGGVRGPSLYGVYGSRVRLADGRVVTADDTWLQEVLVHPERNVVAGWPAAMPSYADALDPEGVVDLVAYLKTLRPGLDPASPRPAAGRPS